VPPGQAPRLVQSTVRVVAALVCAGVAVFLVAAWHPASRRRPRRASDLVARLRRRLDGVAVTVATGQETDPRDANGDGGLRRCRSNRPLRPLRDRGAAHARLARTAAKCRDLHRGPRGRRFPRSGRVHGGVPQDRRSRRRRRGRHRAPPRGDARRWTDRSRRSSDEPPRPKGALCVGTGASGRIRQDRRVGWRVGSKSVRHTN
jgi:hypothetical protein